MAIKPYNYDGTNTAITPSSGGGRLKPFVYSETQQVEQKKEEEKKPFSLGKFLKDVAIEAVKLPIRAALNVRETYESTKLLGDIFDEKAFNERKAKIDERVSKGIDSPTFGNLRPIGNTGKGFVADLKDTFGAGLEASSYIPIAKIPSLVAQSLKQSALKTAGQFAKEGVIAGGLGGAGYELQNPDSTLGSIAKSTAIGSATGGVLGGVLGGATGAISKTLSKKIKPFDYSKVTETPVAPTTAPTAMETPKVGEVVPTTPSIPKELEPLAAEAQKYKSAEEFVKGQGTPVFRGQSHEGFTAFDGKDKSRFLPGMKGTSFSTTRESALNYGDKVIEGVIPNSEIFRGSDVNPTILNDLKSAIKNLTHDDYVDGTGFERIVSKLAKMAESKNKTAIDLTEFFPKSKIDDEIRVLSPDAIKTKSQLTDIWNKVKTETVETPTGAPKPVTAEADALPSRVFKRLQAEDPSIEGDLNYNPIKLKEDAEKAVNLIAKDRQKAFDIAMGKETSSDVTSTAVNIAMAEKALNEGNTALYSRLIKNRSLEQTRRGQEIVAEKASVTDNSTSRYVKELIGLRLEKLGNTYLSDLKDVTKRTSTKQKGTNQIEKEVQKVQRQIKDKKLTMQDARQLLDALSCV